MSVEHATEKTSNVRGQQPCRKYAAWLWFLLGLFCLRVLGQALVVFFHASFLPPVEQWYSGLISYPWLLLSQCLIILLYGKVCIDFTRGYGFFIAPRKTVGHIVRWFSYVYFASMLLRYILTMTFHSEARWFGGTIPIFLHWVLAGFLFTFGPFHTRRDTQNRIG